MRPVPSGSVSHTLVIVSVASKLFREHSASVTLTEPAALPSAGRGSEAHLIGKQSGDRCVGVLYPHSPVLIMQEMVIFKSVTEMLRKQQVLQNCIFIILPHIRHGNYVSPAILPFAKCSYSVITDNASS